MAVIALKQVFWVFLEKRKNNCDTTVIYMGLALQDYYNISSFTECALTELFLLSSTNENTHMKDGFLISVKSLLGGEKGCGED